MGARMLSRHGLRLNKIDLSHHYCSDIDVVLLSVDTNQKVHVGALR